MQSSHIITAFNVLTNRYLRTYYDIGCYYHIGTFKRATCLATPLFTLRTVHTRHDRLWKIPRPGTFLNHPMDSNQKQKLAVSNRLRPWVISRLLLVAATPQWTRSSCRVFVRASAHCLRTTGLGSRSTKRFHDKWWGRVRRVPDMCGFVATAVLAMESRSN